MRNDWPRLGRQARVRQLCALPETGSGCSATDSWSSARVSEAGNERERVIQGSQWWNVQRHSNTTTSRKRKTNNVTTRTKAWRINELSGESICPAGDSNSQANHREIEQTCESLGTNVGMVTTQGRDNCHDRMIISGTDLCVTATTARDLPTVGPRRAR